MAWSVWMLLLFMKKKIIIILIILAITSIGSTIALYSDTETSYENTFQVGILDLSIEDATQTIPLSFLNMQSYERKTDFIKTKNIGTLPFELSIDFDNTNNEGGVDLLEIMEGEIFIERDLLYYIYKFKETEDESWLDKFIQKIEYLLANGLISETEALGLIDKAQGFKGA
jgi:predicted ribosomally synthesized peptide with SipW-like signal peptide